MLPFNEVTTGGASEGDKYVCLDSLMDDVKRGYCLVYSFGIENDWTFEQTMVAVGCQVCSSLRDSSVCCCIMP